jgi:hypothetical protein
MPKAQSPDRPRAKPMRRELGYVCVDSGEAGALLLLQEVAERRKRWLVWHPLTLCIAD